MTNSSASARRSVNRQSGFSLLGTLLVPVVGVLLAILVVRLIPAFTEFYTVKSAADEVAKSDAVISGRQAFQQIVRRANVNNPLDLSLSAGDVSLQQKDGAAAIHIEYDTRVPLFGPFSLMIHFDHLSPVTNGQHES